MERNGVPRRGIDAVGSAEWGSSDSDRCSWIRRPMFVAERPVQDDEGPVHDVEGTMQAAEGPVHDAE